MLAVATSGSSTCSLSSFLSVRSTRLTESRSTAAAERPVQTNGSTGLVFLTDPMGIGTIASFSDAFSRRPFTLSRTSGVACSQAVLNFFSVSLLFKFILQSFLQLLY